MKKSILIIMGIFLAVTLAAQESVFFPFVSKLTAEIRSEAKLVRLLWRDSPDAKGPVYIYSADRPLADTGTLSSQLPKAQVPYGEQFYVDDILDYKSRWYFVAASDETGRIYFQPSIQFANNITVTFEDPVPPPTAEPQAQPAATEQLAPKTGDDYALKAVLQGESIVITFNTPVSGSSMILYRGTEPLNKAEDLVKAVLVQSEAVSPFVDFPAPGYSYYYAIVRRDALRSGSVVINPGNNATTYSVNLGQRAEGRRTESSAMRAMPIPLISLSALFNVTPTPALQKLTPAAQDALSNIKKNNNPIKLRQPYVFEEDKNPNSSTGDYTLRSIIQNVFMKNNWNNAKEQLLQFLSLPRGEELEKKAHFYLGQAYYFMAKPEESLFEFLAVRYSYPREAAEWIQAVLEQFTD